MIKNTCLDCASGTYSHRWDGKFFVKCGWKKLLPHLSEGVPEDYADICGGYRDLAWSPEAKVDISHRLESIKPTGFIPIDNALFLLALGYTVEELKGFIQSGILGLNDA